MKQLVVLVALLAGGGWYFFGRGLSERDIGEHYRMQDEAMLALDADKACSLLSNDFHGLMVSHIGPHAIREVLDKQDACDNVQNALRPLQKIKSAAGDLLPIESSHAIQRIEHAPDGKSAKVDVRHVTRIGDVRMTTRSTDTIARRWGRVLTTHTDGKVWVETSR